MRELTKMTAKSRTITGKIVVRNSEGPADRIDRLHRALGELGDRFGLNIEHGVPIDLHECNFCQPTCRTFIKNGGCNSDPNRFDEKMCDGSCESVGCTCHTLDVKFRLTITGIEQRETVPQKWARALAAVSAEYGLDCTWEEELIDADHVPCAEHPDKRIGGTIVDLRIDGVEYKAPMSVARLSGDIKIFPTFEEAQSLSKMLAPTMEKARVTIPEMKALTERMKDRFVDAAKAGTSLRKALAAVSPTGRGGKEYPGGTLAVATEETASKLRSDPSKTKILIHGEPDPPPTKEMNAELSDYAERVGAELRSTNLSPQQLMGRIEELTGVVSARAICNELGTAVVSLWVEEGPFHFDAVKAEIKAMLPLGVELKLTAQAAAMADADMEMPETAPWETPDKAILTKTPPTPYLPELPESLEGAKMGTVKVDKRSQPGISGERTPSPQSYADTPTGTVAWDAVEGQKIKRGLDGYGPMVRWFFDHLHLTNGYYGDDLTDLMCPCCGTDCFWPRFYAQTVGELLAAHRDSDLVGIEDMKSGITCKCGVKSTYDFESQTIKLELVK